MTDPAGNSETCFLWSRGNKTHRHFPWGQSLRAYCHLVGQSHERYAVEIYKLYIGLVEIEVKDCNGFYLVLTKFLLGSIN